LNRKSTMRTRSAILQLCEWSRSPNVHVQKSGLLEDMVNIPVLSKAVTRHQ